MPILALGRDSHDLKKKKPCTFISKSLARWLFFTLKCQGGEERKMQHASRLRADREGKLLKIFHKYQYEKQYGHDLKLQKPSYELRT